MIPSSAIVFIRYSIPLNFSGATAAVWQELFAQVPYDTVSRALMNYIATDTKGFPPVPGAINEQIGRMMEAEGLSESEAWCLVYKAVCRGIYNSQEEFGKLPEEIRRIVGHPRQLHEWAMLDAHEVNTVIAAGFKRSWRARKELEKALGGVTLLRIEGETEK